MWIVAYILNVFGKMKENPLIRHILGLFRYDGIVNLRGIFQHSHSLIAAAMLLKLNPMWELFVVYQLLWSFPRSIQNLILPRPDINECWILVHSATRQAVYLISCYLRKTNWYEPPFYPMFACSKNVHALQGKLLRPSSKHQAVWFCPEYTMRTTLVMPWFSI